MVHDCEFLRSPTWPVGCTDGTVKSLNLCGWGSLALAIFAPHARPLLCHLQRFKCPPEADVPPRKGSSVPQKLTSLHAKTGVCCLCILFCDSWHHCHLMSYTFGTSHRPGMYLICLRVWLGPITRLNVKRMSPAAHNLRVKDAVVCDCISNGHSQFPVDLSYNGGQDVSHNELTACVAVLLHSSGRLLVRLCEVEHSGGLHGLFPWPVLQGPLP